MAQPAPEWSIMVHVLRGVACTAICINFAVRIVYGFGGLKFSPKKEFTDTLVGWYLFLPSLQFYEKLIFLLTTTTTTTFGLAASLHQYL